MSSQLYKPLYDLKAKINFSTFIGEVYKSRMRKVKIPSLLFLHKFGFAGIFR
ncbi:hypothetical protein LEP1GSC036_4721 [Leptospira weilii str. 2006001853]|uniref:Uncharacterized protein n=3 Tax=Leptospira weilii TaxID=28184 RepID=A0A828Z727_9LEPT|nr:hypothetical protein LEP1GSC036_4721 [Leptospira weilii str. 2006001853]EMJ60747.1 hypothetical protein LEP1GSC051_1137 [Leptospira sp. P2653]EMM71952.1 hypothetical protein LEP1GSC038_4275 [Leptospira weilii str. 2006001855]EMN45727.1 hypothetical protein LEP1GSC086_2606 [Leptospira weilii str. LNT 1234]EMN88744.1 hypothetical protein LEP1GSC108_1414 [Leptospira weilii str. UI 13098]